MQLFFMDYGLWLLIALLVVIALVFLLSGRKRTGALPSARQMPAEAFEPEVAQPIAALVDTATLEPAPTPPVPAVPVEKTSIPVSPAATAAPEADDDLLKLKGVGPKLRTRLIEVGVTRFAQIAAWTDADIAAIDAKLGAFKGRPVRDQWIDQAKYLAAGDIAGFEAKYGKL